MEPPYTDVFAALDDAGVDFVVVGGMAVIAHGHARLTVDVDLVIDLAPAAAAAAIDALLALGLRPRLPVDAADFADPDIRLSWVRDRGLQVFTMHDPEDPTRQVDLFATPPVRWPSLRDEATTVEIAGRSVRIASLSHLIEMKLEAGRPRDHADVEALQGLQDAQP